MNTMPQTFEETLAAVDEALLSIIKNGRDASVRIRAISIFYKRHQVGGFAPSKTAQARTVKSTTAPPAQAAPPVHHPAPAPTLPPTATTLAALPPPAPSEPVSASSAMPPPPLQSLSIPDQLRAIRKTLSTPHNKGVSQRRR